MQSHCFSLEGFQNIVVQKYRKHDCDGWTLGWWSEAFSILNIEYKNWYLNSYSVIRSDVCFKDSDIWKPTFEFTAVYGGGSYVGVLDSGKIGNLIPKIIDIIADTLINRPEGRNINLIIKWLKPKEILALDMDY